MQDAQDFDVELGDAIDRNKRSARDDQLPRILHAPFAAHKWVLRQRINLALYQSVQPFRGARAVLGDVVELRIARIKGGSQPANFQSFAPSSLSTPSGATITA